MKRALHLDVESFNEIDLGAAGVYRYAEHESSEILCFSYAFGNDAVKSWRPRQPLPDDVVAHIRAGNQVRAFNAQFERVVLNGVAGKKIGFPEISITQTVCVAAKTAAAGLPRALGNAADALGAAPKSLEGRVTMLQLCKPRKKHPDGRYTPENAPEKFEILYQYCAEDVIAERDIDHRVPDLSPAEQEVYELDQVINARGVAVDTKAIADIQAVIEEYKKYLAAELLDLCGYTPGQREKIADWIRNNGWPRLTDMQAATVKDLLLRDDVPKSVKRALTIYSTYNLKAVTKYDAILAAICRDERLRGMFLYHGAGTGRWSSLIVQLQNLFRPVIKDPETAIAAFAARDLGAIRWLYDGIDPMKVAASCVRSVLVSAPGKDLLFQDYAGIESRGCAWLFDEEWKLQAFRAQDNKTGPDTYRLAYANMFNIDPAGIGKEDPRRQIGKTTELFFQYEGGVGAFVTGAGTVGINLEELTRAVLPIIPADIRESAEWMWENLPGTRNDLSYDTYIACDSLKRLWRQKHPRIVQGWKDLKSAAELAVQNPGVVYKIPSGKIMFRVHDQWLYMRLPSGRRLAYFRPTWIETDEGKGEIRYMGIDTTTRQFKDVSTYGGRLCENAVQALSRDVMVNGMTNLERAGYEIIGTVHDEVITEVPEGFGSMEEAAALMCKLPDWASGLPLAVEGHRGKRYRK